MGKRERIERLEGETFTLRQIVDELSKKVTQLLADDARQKTKNVAPDLSHFEKKSSAPSINVVQDKWGEKNLGLLKKRELTDKGPVPFAHPRRGVGV